MSVVVEYLFLACALLFRHAPFAAVEQTSEIETPTALRHFWQSLYLRLNGFFERYPTVRRCHNLHSLQRIDVGNEEYGVASHLRSGHIAFHVALAHDGGTAVTAAEREMPAIVGVTRVPRSVMIMTSRNGLCDDMSATTPSV